MTYIHFFIDAIPFFFIEIFIMMFVTFLIGYIGATIVTKSKINRLNEEHLKLTNDLKSNIAFLQKKLEHINNLDKKEDIYPRKDRMNQDFEQLKIHKRAFSKDVISNKLPDKKETPLNFNRIGIANKADRNDLQKISGIGSFTEIKLNELGIYTYKQISNFTEEDITIITELIKFFPDRIKNDKWVSKAKNLYLEQENKGKPSATINAPKKEITS